MNFAILPNPATSIWRSADRGIRRTWCGRLEYAKSIGCRTLAPDGRDGGKLGRSAELNIPRGGAAIRAVIEDAHHYYAT